jgi:phosphoribosylanthranilate isomerase
MPQQSKVETWCKICGITTRADAEAAQAAGADALGFNCYAASPRYIAPRDIAKLTHAIGVTKVALFVNATRAEVERVVGSADIDLLQFQGDEDEAFCASFELPYMKAIRVRPDLDVGKMSLDFESAWALLLDAYVADQPGGTGQQFDWNQWPDLPGRRLVLAGGLTPHNVAAAAGRLQPFGVDVCGGVEGSVKGLKDQGKVAKFIEEVRSVRA